MAKRQDAAAIVRQIDAELDRLARLGRRARQLDDDSTPLYAVGERVEIQWRTQWYEGEVLAVNGDRYLVRYMGWEADWDEDVGPERLRRVPGGRNRLAVVVERGHARFGVGDVVMIEWDGAWYDGTILAVEGKRYRVRYDHWDESWDETVGVQRLRLLVTPKPAKKPAARKSAAKKPSKKPPKKRR